MLFAKANSESRNIIKAILDKYYSMFDQLVNFHKSTFQCTFNVSSEACLAFKKILCMDNAFSKGNYLRCPIIDTRVTKNTFGSVLKKTRNQLSKWKANSLSQAGRAVLIHSNLATKANFQMQSFSLASAVLHDLDKTNKNFFWNKEHNAGVVNMIGWDTLYMFAQVLGWVMFQKG